MNKISTFLLLLTLGLFFTQAELNAQNSKVITLEESIEAAKLNSPLARAAKFSLVASKWRFRSFRADLLPGISISGDAPNYNKSIFSNILDDGTVTFSSRTQSEASLGLTVNQSILPTGGNLSISSGITRLGIFENENTYLWQSTPFVASLNQPLFQFNALKWRNITEPLRYQISQKQFVEDMEDIAFTVTQNFFDVLVSKINVEVAQFNVTVNDSIYNISRGRFEVGRIAENDLLQSELAYRNAEASLTSANLNYQRSLENFAALIGLDPDDEFEIATPEFIPEVSVNFEQALSLAQENNSTSLEFRLSEILADQEYERARRGSGFSATLRASYGLNQTSRDLSTLYEDPQNRQFVTVGFEIPIFNWGKERAEINAAKNVQQETANTIAYQKQQFDLQVKSTVREFELLRSQVLLAAISDTIATKRYDVSRNRYLIGSIDVTNLFIAQNEKDSARRSYVQALRTYWTGYYNLRRLTLYDFEEDQPIVYEMTY